MTAIYLYYGGYYYTLDNLSEPYMLTLVALIALMILGLVVQAVLKSTFKKYSKVLSKGGRTASDVAQEILNSKGSTVGVSKIAGSLTDNFNPKANQVCLSEDVYGSTSVAALAVAMHEIGHVMQYEEGYTPIKIRNTILPAARIGSGIAPYIVIIGLLFSSFNIAMIGVVLYAAVLGFQLVTLPVEFNASSRALHMLEAGGYLQRDEIPGARSVLRMAAMTYVVGTLATLVSLLRLLLLASGTRRRR